MHNPRCTEPQRGNPLPLSAPSSALVRALAKRDPWSTGSPRLIQHTGRTGIYPIHLGWVQLVFSTIIHFWWHEFHLNVVEGWTIPLLANLIVGTVGNWALAALLFAEELNEFTAYEHYFEARKRGILRPARFDRRLRSWRQPDQERGLLCEPRATIARPVGRCRAPRLTPDHRLTPRGARPAGRYRSARRSRTCQSTGTAHPPPGPVNGWRRWILPPSRHSAACPGP